MKNYGINNEVDYINFFKTHIENGIHNFVFKGENGVSKSFKNIVNVDAVTKVTRRSTDRLCNKGDIILIDSAGNKFPVSIKMSGVKTAWESADYSLKHLLYNFIHCYGRIDIPNNIIVRIDSHEEQLSQYVFGDDIIPHNGSIFIQTINTAKYVKYNDNTIICNIHRLFNQYEEIETDIQYCPVIGVKKDTLRNRHDGFLNGYRIQVIPRHISTSIIDIIDII